MLSDETYRKYTDTVPLHDFEIWTDTGWEDLSAIMQTVPYERYEITLDDGKRTECADTHILFDKDLNEIYAKDTLGVEITTVDGCSKVVDVKRTGIVENMYDLTVQSSHHRYYGDDILSHNSITSVAWLLHYAIFNPDKKIGILANKGATAREMLSRITLMLENLPFFLQPGCKILNKGNIKFSNNSEIIAAATSGSSIRGLSMNCVTGDTKICICVNDAIYCVKIDDCTNKSKLIQKHMHYIVYKITNKVNGKIYVGYHSTHDIDDGYMGSGKLIKRAIEKYGIDQFNKEILAVYNNKEEAEAEEKRIVDRDFTLREDIYNLPIGGNVCVLYGENNGFYGKKHSAETCEKISKANTARQNPNSNRIKHHDGRIFYNVDDAISQLMPGSSDNIYSSRIKIIYECGRPDSEIEYVDAAVQSAAEEYYIKKNEYISQSPHEAPPGWVNTTKK